jgi:RNA polymerase sigma-70 factor (ECF subfamily)
MADNRFDSDALLLEAAGRGDRSALEQLLESYRVQLRQAIALRLPWRLSARIDPSDVVQETMVEATRRFDQYLKSRRIAFYPWLRRLAADQLAVAQRKHFGAQERSVSREEVRLSDLSDTSWNALADCLASSITGPLARLVHQEARHRVLTALASLTDIDREVLVLRFLEDLSVTEAAQVLDISDAALKMRQLRAVQRLQRAVGDEE